MPRDLVQLYRRGDTLTLRTTEDDSASRLELRARTADWAGLRIELSAWEVQRLASGLLQWLADSGQPLPDAPAGWLLTDQALELDDGPTRPQPATVVVPEHTR